MFLNNLRVLSSLMSRLVKMLFIFQLCIRSNLQKLNKVTLEICSITIWTRMVKVTIHFNMNSIAFGKFEDTLRADVFKIVTTSTIVAIIMMNFLRSIDINLNGARAFTYYWWSSIKGIDSIIWTGEISIWFIESRTNIVFNIFPNNWIKFFLFYQVNYFLRICFKMFYLDFHFCLLNSH